MKKTRARFLSLLLILLLIQTPALAAKKGVATKSFVPLTPGETCSKYDFTHDGKADKLKLDFDYDAQLWTIYLNGKKKGTVEIGRGGGQALAFAPTAKNAMLVFLDYPTHSKVPLVYRYASGKFKMAHSMPLGEGAMGKATPDKVTGKTVTVILENTRTDDVFDYDGTVQFKVTYTVSSKGKFALKSRKNPAIVDNMYATAMTDFTTSESATDTGTDGPAVSKGEIVYLKNIYIPKGGSGALYEIEVNGKRGWINSDSMRNDNWPLLAAPVG